MIKTIISFVSAIILSVSFSAFSKTKVTWSMESNADRDPIFLEKLQNAYNNAQDIRNNEIHKIVHVNCLNLNKMKKLFFYISISLLIHVFFQNLLVHHQLQRH